MPHGAVWQQTAWSCLHVRFTSEVAVRSEPIIDRAIQVRGALDYSNDAPLAAHLSARALAARSRIRAAFQIA